MADHGELKQIIEVGRIIIADWSDVYYLYKDVTVQEVANETASDPTEPFAVIKHGRDGYNVAMLLASVIAEGFPAHGQPIELPSYFWDDLKFGSDIGKDEDDGNLGTKSDNAAVKILDKHGREIEP